MISSRPIRFAARVALALLMAGTVLAAPIVAFADSSKQPAITEARADGGMLLILAGPVFFDAHRLPAGAGQHAIAR